MTDADDANGDDAGWWSCSLCTYRNSAEKFKCEICDLRRGTSTRKPRCSADIIVAQVMKQQEQIQLQTVKAKPTPPSRVKTTKDRDRDRAGSPTTLDRIDSSSPQDNNQPSKTDKVTTASVARNSSSKPLNSKESSQQDRSQDDSIKIRPVKMNGNLIKYLPPTSTGRTGLIIDKKRFTQHSVTVYDVTITFTEFATRQNNYVRKKKKSSKNSSGNQQIIGKS